MRRLQVILVAALAISAGWMRAERQAQGDADATVRASTHRVRNASGTTFHSADCGGVAYSAAV